MKRKQRIQEIEAKLAAAGFKMEFDFSAEWMLVRTDGKEFDQSEVPAVIDQLANEFIELQGEEDEVKKGTNRIKALENALWNIGAIINNRQMDLDGSGYDGTEDEYRILDAIGACFPAANEKNDLPKTGEEITAEIEKAGYYILEDFGELALAKGNAADEEPEEFDESEIPAQVKALFAKFNAIQNGGIK